MSLKYSCQSLLSSNQVDFSYRSSIFWQCNNGRIQLGLDIQTSPVILLTFSQNLQKSTTVEFSISSINTLKSLIGRIKFIINRRLMQKKANTTSNYKFTQLFGYKGNEKVQEEDMISSLKFDNQGKYIALGDRAGRVIVFQNSKEGSKNSNQMDYLTEFQAHDQEFDALKSTDIQEAIVDINWFSRQGKYLKMATTNSKRIKMWKIYQYLDKKVVKSAGKELSMPKLENIDIGYRADLQKTFPSFHLNPIKQISQSFNQQYLLSADESQMFLWDVERSQRPYLLCDRTGKLEDHHEIINCCQMHPRHDSIFLYGMSKGVLNVGDLRTSSNADKNGISFKSITGRQTNILLDLISNISSATFTKNSRYIVCRDYLTVKIWDVCNPKKPLNTIMLQESLKSKLSEMVDNQAIYDEFKVSVSSDSSTIITGCYNNNFHMLDLEGNNSQYELSYKQTTICKTPNKNPIPITRLDYQKKTAISDFNPAKNMVAVASLNCFFTYNL